MTPATTPLDGTELVPLVQSGGNVQGTVSDFLNSAVATVDLSTAASAGNTGAISLTTGKSSGADSGSLTLKTGDADGTRGSIVFDSDRFSMPSGFFVDTGANRIELTVSLQSADNGSGSGVALNAGPGGDVSGTGGDVQIFAGSASASGSDGGAVLIAAGDGSGAGVGGTMTILSGQGGGDSGLAQFGAGNTTGAGNGGGAVVLGGDANFLGNGGDVEIHGGFASSADPGTHGGNVILTIGDTAAGGSQGTLQIYNIGDGKGVATGTIKNAPHAADPSIWMKVTINGTICAIPAWTV